MSGIAALFERTGAPASPARIEGMLRRLRHRGPDRAATQVDGPLALAHCLRATTPEDGIDAQPLRMGTRSIVADVRLDNRDELARALELDASDALRTSDAALVLRAYDRWGDACPRRLVGDFAFVIGDGAKVFCARDPLGVRPLYHHASSAAFRAASEMHALFADDRVQAVPHTRSMELFLAGEYTEREETLWRGVLALPAGHTLVIGPETSRKQAYWRPDPSRRVRYASDDAYAQHFGAVFSEAVRCRLRSPSPVVAQVSGGLDSSSVACEAERLRRIGRAGPGPVHLVRATFPGLGCDESVHSQAVADHLGLPIASAAVSLDRALCRPVATGHDIYFHPTLRSLDPLADLAHVVGARTMLTGMGGDQLMQPSEHDIASLLRGGRIGPAARAAGVVDHPFALHAWRRLASQGLSAFADRGSVARMRARRHPARDRYPLLSPSVARRVLEVVVAGEIEASQVHPDPQTAWFCRALTDSPSTTLALALQDRASQLRGVELRHPFLDVRLVDLLLAFPIEQRFADGVAKPVLRRAMAGSLPDLVRGRQDKASFDCYVRRSLLEEHGDALRKLFRRSRLEEIGMIDGDHVRSRLHGLRADPRVFDLVNLVALELWLEKPALSPASLETPFPDPGSPKTIPSFA